jgi:hypothetical protein
LKVKIPASFFKMSPLTGPTPFKYSIGLLNMEAKLVMMVLFFVD